jgi:hypothetical protein
MSATTTADPGSSIGYPEYVEWADVLIRQHAAWIDGQDPAIPADLYDTLDAVGSLPPIAVRLVAAQQTLVESMARLGAAWTAWQAQGGEAAGELPADAVWSALDAVEAAQRTLKAPPPKRLETVAELMAQRVPERQICLMYGWLDDEKRPLWHMIGEEIAEPGKHTAGHIPPLERGRREQLAAWAALAEQRKQVRSQKLERIVTAPVAQEPISILAESGVSARQIALMHGISVDDVWAECDEAGVPRPPLDYPPPNTIRGDLEPDMNEAQARILAARTATPHYPPAPVMADLPPEEDGDPEAMLEPRGRRKR